MKTGYVYIMSNSLRTVFYIGVTSDIEFRVLQHKAGVGSRFTSTYNLKELVYYEECEDIESAIAREKQLKNWKRAWKVQLIQKDNPKMKDLALSWFDEGEIEEMKNNVYD